MLHLVISSNLLWDGLCVCVSNAQWASKISEKQGFSGDCMFCVYCRSRRGRRVFSRGSQWGSNLSCRHLDRIENQHRVSSQLLSLHLHPQVLPWNTLLPSFCQAAQGRFWQVPDNMNEDGIGDVDQEILAQMPAVPSSAETVQPPPSISAAFS